MNIARPAAAISQPLSLFGIYVLFEGHNTNVYTHGHDRANPVRFLLL